MHRRTFEGTINGIYFMMVTVCDVITEASGNAKCLIGLSLKDIKPWIKEQEQYEVKELFR
jgi:hypothetical protein